MTNLSITRRQLLIGACCMSLGVTSCVVTDKTDKNVLYTEPYPRNAIEALDRLKRGNQRFMAEKSLHAHEKFSWRNLLVEAQKPFASVIGCSDSRVPPELIFDVGFGDIFTIRLAGNIIAEDVVGSLQYAGSHLHTPLFVVLGHEGCGAVAATLDAILHHAHEPEHIESLIKLIRPGLRELDFNQSRENLLHAAVEANVRWSMQQLLMFPEAKRALEERHVILVGAVYELKTGRVRFLS